jgi:hypothetical protein
MDDLYAMIHRGLTEPEASSQARQRFIADFFDGCLDGLSGRRVAETLLDLSRLGVNNHKIS